MQQHITFEQVPQVLENLCEQVNTIKSLLESRGHEPMPIDDKPLIIPKIAEYMSMSVQKVRGLIKSGELSAMRKGKIWYSTKADCNKYLESGRKVTKAEIQASVNTYLSIRKTNGGKHGK